MKRDLNLCRDILLKIESMERTDDYFHTERNKTLNNYSRYRNIAADADETKYHLDLLKKQGSSL